MGPVRKNSIVRKMADLASPSVERGNKTACFRPAWSNASSLSAMSSGVPVALSANTISSVTARFVLLRPGVLESFRLAGKSVPSKEAAIVRQPAEICDRSPTRLDCHPPLGCDTGEHISDNINLARISVYPLRSVADMLQGGAEGIFGGEHQKRAGRDLSGEFQDARAGARDVYRHVASNGSPGQLGAGQSEYLALNVHRLSAQSAPHDVSDLPHPLRRAVISKAVTVFDHTLVAGAEAQHEATAGDFVDRRSTRGNDPRAPYEHRQNPGPEPHPACAHGEGAQQSKNLPPAPLGNPGRRKPLFLGELNALHHVQHGKRAVGLDPEREPVRGNHDRLPPRERSGSRSAQARTASLRPRRPASECRPAKTLPKLSQ